MLAAVAQEESRSISENIKWSCSKRYEKGDVRFTRLLGYKKGENKEWEIVNEEAKIVREAFNLCISGVAPTAIARIFISKGYKTSQGNKGWSGVPIRDILRNERYVGDVLCQKTYVKDYLSHKSIKNNGIKNQYLIRNHHQAIIDRETFEKVGNILVKRSMPQKYKKNRKTYPLSGRLTCGNCGSNLQRYVCREVVTWRCGEKMKSKLLCKMKGVKEEYIIKGIRKAIKASYDFSKPKKAIRKMIRDLKDVDFTSDTSQFQLRLELERALFEENSAVVSLDDGKIKLLKAKRIEIEKKLEEEQAWIHLLDLDENLRIEAKDRLNKILRMDNTLELLEKELEKIEFLRAWVVRVEAISPFSFNISLANGSISKVNISKGDKADD